MRDAVIVEAVRSPLGKRNGGLSGVHSVDLSAAVIRALVGRSGVDPHLLDDVIWGCVSQIGEQTFDIGRTAALAAGLPEAVTGVTIDRACGSSQQAVHFAAAGLVAGHYDWVVAGGVESMSRTPMFSPLNGKDPLGEDYQQRYGEGMPNQGLGAEILAERYGLSRTQLDEYSLRSHERATAAWADHLFDAEVVPVAGVSMDEGIRHDGTLEDLAKLKTVFREDGVVTAGNGSQISDGSAALLLTTSENATAHGLRPLARVHTVALAGVAPMPMLDGPIPATRRALKRAGLTVHEIGAWEVNEAFAPVPLAWQREIGADDKTVNPVGGAIAFGHPLGGSGARLMTTLVHHMRRQGIRYGLQTMCEAGGQANATVLELL